MAPAGENADLAPQEFGLRIIRDAAGFAGFAGIKPVAPDIADCIPTLRGELEVTVGLHPR